MLRTLCPVLSASAEIKASNVDVIKMLHASRFLKIVDHWYWKQDEVAAVIDFGGHGRIECTREWTGPYSTDGLVGVGAFPLRDRLR